MAEQHLSDHAVAEQNQDHGTKKLGECFSEVLPDIAPQESMLDGWGVISCWDEVMERLFVLICKTQRAASTVFGAR